MSILKEEVLLKDRWSPLLIEPSSTCSLPDVFEARRNQIQDRLLTHGALLFRGFNIRAIADFDAAIAGLSPDRMDYLYGSTPRTALGNRVFTATEYPETQEIPLHNENAYQKEWPLKIALCCLTPADHGGETPVANMRAVTAAIGHKLMDDFERKKIMYVRHYRPFVDVPWQKVFGTDDRDVVATFCEEHEIEHEWLDKETLRTRQVCQGVAHHPATGERTFFNQAHLFHLSSVGPHAAKALSELYGERVPRQTYFGNGQEIPGEDLARTRAAFESAKLTFKWQAGDVLLVDNMQVAHGRMPFKGKRKVVVALMEPYSLAVSKEPC
jgi:alpha-ketoglutarate-dependent taurine dioxygenase